MKQDADIEAQYNALAGRPDYGLAVLPDWTRRSAAYRAAAPCSLDVVYGPGPRERLDVFPAAGASRRPTLVYFHGGYWQRGDKSLYSFIAEPFVKNGVSVVIVNYDLCPAVSLSHITARARGALAWIWRHAGRLGLSAGQLFVMGHSAGGHLAAMIMAADWPAIGSGLPQDLVKGGIPISGVYELAPLRRTSINDALQMDGTEARELSPVNHPPHPLAPQLVVCGGAESAEFHRQADLYSRRYSTSERPIERHTVPGCDHFDILNELARESSAFFGKALRLAGA